MLLVIIIIIIVCGEVSSLCCMFVRGCTHVLGRI